jgi:hypothetical protein
VNALTPRQAVVLGRALADALAYRKARAGAYCARCEAEYSGLCLDHVKDEEAADDYAALICELTTTDTPALAVPPPGSSGRRGGFSRGDYRPLLGQPRQRRRGMTGPQHYQEAETQAESAARAIDDRMFNDGCRWDWPRCTRRSPWPPPPV